MSEPQYKPITGMINVNDIQEIIENNNYYRKEIERLKEDYIILQNASDEVEEEKDKEIERLNNILKDVLRRQNEALKYIGNFLSMDDRYKHGNGNDQMKTVRNILNKHNEELKGVDKNEKTS